MEDSAFSSDFATSFLTWDDGETAAPAPGPAESQNSKQAESDAGAAITQQSVNIQQQNAQDRYSWLPQYQVMMGNPALGQQMAMAPGQQFAATSHMLNMAPPSFQGMMSHSQTHANAIAVGLANMQQNVSTHQEGLGASHMSAAGHNATQLHPLGIQSSANCPPHVPTASFLPLVYNPFLQHGAVAPNQQLWTMVHANQQQQQQNQLAQQQYQQVQQQQNQQAQQLNYQAQQQNYQAQQQNHQAQQRNHQVQQENHHAQQQGHQAPQHNNQVQQQNHQVPQQNTQAQPQNHQVPQQNNQVQQQAQKQLQQQSQGSQQASVPAPAAVTHAQPVPVGPAPTVSTQPNGKPMPPFYLFDAPCELRANFLQSQNLHNLPVSEDNNSFHYGMVVNGFHPQRNAQANPGQMHMFPPLVDGRSKKSRKAGSERNEREQKRAQKITDLIETLRYSMEKGGWKVEMKSKYHTLSTCADYLKHLAQATKEKEELVKKAKTKLEMTERKIEEEKATVERSDPESVASSLTCGSKRKDKREGDGERNSDQDEDVKVKKVKIIDSTSETSSNDSQRRGGPGMKNISLDKMSSGISDISDSNKGSSKSGDGTNGKSSEGSCLEGAVSPVASNGKANEDWGHPDVVVKVRKQQRVLPEPVEKNREMTSLDSDFELDYNEVFVSSNVPQLIATPTGRIVTCNDFLVKAIGLSKEDVSRLTIFSLVQADKLSSLFEMVAEALRCDRHDRNRVERSEDGSGGEGSDSSGNTTNESSKSGESRRWVYPSMTLPCVSFPSRTKPGSPHHPNPLYMTISLMTDEDPQKRCFHCMLTDDPGTNGSVGFITPELLALLFAPEPPKSTLLRDLSSKSKTESKYHAQSSSSYGDDNRTDSYMFNDDEDEDDEDDMTDSRETSEF